VEGGGGAAERAAQRRSSGANVVPLYGGSGKIRRRQNGSAVVGITFSHLETLHEPIESFL